MYITLLLLQCILCVTHISCESSEPDERIIGGSPARPGAYPYQASLRDQSGNHVCGGSIITNYHILTAAHCFILSIPMVTVGSNRLSQGTPYYIGGVKIHEGFINDFPYPNDIAIIYLQTPLVTNQWVKVIPLQEYPASSGTLCVLTGWGNTQCPVTGSPDELQELQRRTIDTYSCNRSFQQALDEKHLCTGSGGGTASFADSGGPLVASGRQIGIASFIQYTNDCGISYPNVYANVPNYIQWIKYNTGIL